jgi:multidrug resistance efflux pump
MRKLFQLIRDRKNWKYIGYIIALATVVGGIYYYLKTEGRVVIDNSLVNTQIISLSPVTPGKLKSIYVAEGQKVSKGEALANVGSEIVRAYTDGLIVTTNKSIGAIVSAQTPVVQMIDITNLRIDGAIDENKGLNDIKVGQVASFTVDALPGRVFWGYVDEISSTARATSLAFSISSQRPTQQFDVYVRFNSLDYPEIKNGMSAKITVYTKSL